MGLWRGGGWRGLGLRGGDGEFFFSFLSHF